VTDTACNGTGFIVAAAGSNPSLGAGSIENRGPELNLRLVNTGAPWTRTYDPCRILGEASPEPNFSLFAGCYRETYPDLQTENLGFSGNLFIWFETHKGKPTVRLTWHFDYFNSPGTTRSTTSRCSPDRSRWTTSGREGLIRCAGLACSTSATIAISLSATATIPGRSRWTSS
jgi:hypothetical protein